MYFGCFSCNKSLFHQIRRVGPTQRQIRVILAPGGGLNTGSGFLYYISGLQGTTELEKQTRQCQKQAL